MKVTTKYKFKMKELRDSPPNITVGEDNWEKLESELINLETEAIDCGTFEERANPVLNHDGNKRAHPNLVIDGNDRSNSVSATLEDHEVDKNAHANMVIDANTF